MAYLFKGFWRVQRLDWNDPENHRNHIVFFRNHIVAILYQIWDNNGAMAIKLVVVTLTITSVCWFNSMYVMLMIRWEWLPSYEGILPAISPAACAGLDWDPTYASEFAHDMCMILENAFLHLNPYRHRATCSWLLNLEWPSMRSCTLCKITHQNDGYSVVQSL